MDDAPEVITIADDEIEQTARRLALLRINPHFYYDAAGAYGKVIIPRGTWITLELGVRSFGWTEVEKSPDVLRMLNQVGLAACEYVDSTVIRPAHADDPQ
jgi:hypothetical protein